MVRDKKQKSGDEKGETRLMIFWRKRIGVEPTEDLSTFHRF